MELRIHGRWLLAFAAVATVFLTGAGGSLLQPSTATAAEEVCRQCHEDVAAKFDNSFHAKAWKGMGQTGGCVDCHGNADTHQNDPGRKTIFSFGKKSVQSAEEQTQRCMSCHAASSANLAMWDMGAHKKNDVTCSDCHSIHMTRNIVTQPETCNGCHRDIRTQINKQSHHPIVEGKVSCSDCHNPHGTLSENMLKADNINQLCYGCHADKRGPFIREHHPVEENCLICHTPHGSRYDKLLTQRIPNLCQDCHADPSNHHDDPYDATRAIAGASASNRFFGKSCLNCHSVIHGSTYFGKTALTR